MLEDYNSQLIGDHELWLGADSCISCKIFVAECSQLSLLIEDRLKGLSFQSTVAEHVNNARNTNYWKTDHLIVNIPNDMDVDKYNSVLSTTVRK